MNQHIKAHLAKRALLSHSQAMLQLHSATRAMIAGTKELICASNDHSAPRRIYVHYDMFYAPYRTLSNAPCETIPGSMILPQSLAQTILLPAAMTVQRYEMPVAACAAAAVTGDRQATEPGSRRGAGCCTAAAGHDKHGAAGAAAGASTSGRQARQQGAVHQVQRHVLCWPQASCCLYLVP